MINVELIRKKDVLWITKETGALETQSRVLVLPAIDAVPVVHGQWICDGSKHGSLGGVCSQCYLFFRIAKYYEYCPNCGAKMDAKEEEREV